MSLDKSAPKHTRQEIMCY